MLYVTMRMVHLRGWRRLVVACERTGHTWLGVELAPETHGAAELTHEPGGGLLGALARKDAWQALPRRYRALVVLYFRGMPMRRVGLVFGFSESMASRVVKAAVLRARARARATE